MSHGASYGGDFEIVPGRDLATFGLGLLKGKNYDPNKEKLMREQLDNFGVLVSVEKNRRLWWDKVYMYMIQPPTMAELTENLARPIASTDADLAAKDDSGKPKFRQNMCMAPTTLLKEK